MTARSVLCAVQACRSSCARGAGVSITEQRLTVLHWPAASSDSPSDSESRDEGPLSGGPRRSKRNLCAASGDKRQLLPTRRALHWAAGRRAACNRLTELGSGRLWLRFDQRRSLALHFPKRRLRHILVIVLPPSGRRAAGVRGGGGGRGRWLWWWCWINGRMCVGRQSSHGCGHYYSHHHHYYYFEKQEPLVNAFNDWLRPKRQQ